MARTKHRNVSKRQAVRQKTGKTVVNRKYKDTIFRMLFSNKRNLLSLYNALNGRNYEDPEELEIVTLENAVYMGMKNDLAFILDLNLFLFEHQSTSNPNTPPPAGSAVHSKRVPEAGDNEVPVRFQHRENPSTQICGIL